MYSAVSCPLAKSAGSSANTTALKLPVVPLDSVGRVTVSEPERARRGGLGIGHSLAGQRRLPGSRCGISRPIPDEQDLQVERGRRRRRRRRQRTSRSHTSSHRPGWRKRSRRGRRPCASSRHPSCRKHRGQAQAQPSHTTAPASCNGIPHRTRHPSQKTYVVQYHRK